MIIDRAIDIVVEATRDLRNIVLREQQPLTEDQSNRLRWISDQLRALAERR